jgi:hypothetical protein
LQETEKNGELFKMVAPKRNTLFNLIHFSQESSEDPFISQFIHILNNSYSVNFIPYYLCKDQVRVAAKHTYPIASLHENKIPFSSLALPHIQADLPTFLLWDAPLCSQKELFFDMGCISTKVLLAPRHTESFTSYVDLVLESFKEKKIPIIDIGWALCRSFRNALQASFLIEEPFSQLKEVNLWRFSYGASPESCLGNWQATLVLHWLLLQINERTEVEKEIQLVEKPQHSPFYLQFASESTDALYELETIEKKNKILSKITLGDFCRLPQVFPLRDGYKTIIHEFFFQSEDESYKAVLEMLEASHERQAAFSL